MRAIVILRPKEGVGLADFLPLLVEEEKTLWDYMGRDVCRSIAYHAEAPGVIVIDFEVADGAEATRLAADFPLVRAGLFAVEVLPLAPYRGMAALFDPAHGLTPELPPAWQAAMAAQGGQSS